ncbi:glycosyltransferase [Patescibacteria group bacterium]
MKVALVCDDLIQNGGHEKVILDFCEIFPDAPLYTTVATLKWKNICDKKNIKLKTTWIQYLPFITKLQRFYAPFGFYIWALQGIDFSQYDFVISLSSRFAHGIKTKSKHICYMSTVGRMFWESTNYFKNEKIGILGKTFLAPFLTAIRVWDYNAGQRPDYFLCNSKTTQNRIKKYYRREAKIIYPAIDTEEFSKKVDYPEKDYFLVLTRLAHWKRVDVAVDACRNLGLDLKVAGSGPAIGNSKVYLGRVSEEEKIALLQNCIALINTQLEDFGIVPLEAMVCGKPIIAYGRGGALETVVEGVTGEYFNKQTSESLEKVLKSFDPKKYSESNCKKQAAKFDIKIFREDIQSFVDNVYLEG